MYQINMSINKKITIIDTKLAKIQNFRKKIFF